MTDTNYHTVKRLSEILEVSPDTVRNWIANNKLRAEKHNGKYLIPFEGNNDFIVDRIKKKHEKPYLPYIPDELTEYNKWHELIDELSWLFKVLYSDKEEIKAKYFRADHLFVKYLRNNEVTLDSLRSAFLNKNRINSSMVTDDLKRGWYNELSFVVPIKKSTLGLSFKDIDINNKISDLRFSFPSWKIVSCYYAIYFYLRGITLQKEPNFRIREHGAAIAAFKYNLLPSLEKHIWKFPLNISWAPSIRIYKKHMLVYSEQYLQNRYCFHPRAPYKSPVEIFESIYKTFKKRGQTRIKHIQYTLFDYLHDFRIWANYIDISNILALWGKGYKGFLDQNLSFLLFIIGGISELCYMSVHGQEKYIHNLQKLYYLFALNNPSLEKDFIKTPPYQRMIIYNELGFVDSKIELHKESNINEIQLEPN